ncbi:hypothetical protein KY284_005346 [Solanum tuberosum]|nr:hypothetical protein KY284_005346 [Solanum tuberosum]
MKRKVVLSITTDGSLKVKRITIVVTNQFHGQTKKEENEVITVFVGSQMEDSNLTQSSYHITVEEGPDIDDTDDDVQEAPPQLEDGVQSTIDDLKELNLVTLEDPRPTFISALLTPQEERKYFREISGLSTRIAIHYLGIKKGTRPIKQLQRVFCPELVTQIEVEVNKLIEAGFIREVKYPLWISNIVPVKKKNGQIRVCVDFQDLNKDEEYTAFRTPKGIYCYRVMPFGLKNDGATYQRVMQNIFDDMLHKRVECYVDDLVVKTKQREHHLEDLRIIFERLIKFDLKMNPLKCAFGVTSGKFIGFIVHHRGIEVDPAKIDAIQKMLEPKNLRDLCRAPTPGKPLILCIASQEQSLGALLAQENKAKKEQALYYLSRTLIGAELNYMSIEKMCFLYAIKNLRHYFEAYTIKLISQIVYTPQKVVKGQALPNFLAEHPLPGKWETSDEFPDEDAFFTKELLAWTMFFDVSSRRDGARARVVLISPERLILPFSFVLGQTCSNNASEYQALIVGLEMAIDMKIPQLDVYGDSQLIINQLLGSYEVKKEDPLSYH